MAGLKAIGRFLLIAFTVLTMAVTLAYLLQDSFDTKGQQGEPMHYTYFQWWRIALHAPVDIYQSLRGPLKKNK